MGGISGRGLRHVLIKGIARLRSQREELDRINVFPVADGDTGTNLSLTLAAVQDALCEAPHLSAAGAVLQQVAATALDGARGNSGTILAQFAQGMAESVGVASRISLAALARAVASGSAQAREALADPREGTMLSVMSAFAASLGRAAAAPTQRLQQGFATAVDAAREALSRTPEQLPVLREAGVVDAGASGFVALIEGMTLAGPRGRCGQNAPPHAPLVYSDPAGHVHDAFEQRYCTECVISADALDRVAIRDALSTLSLSSLVVAGSCKRVHVHAHIDEPVDLFEACSRHGHLTGQKADDMQAQVASRTALQRVVVVVDSGADVPPGLADRLLLNWVPVRVSFGDEDFIDRTVLRPARFYRMMRAGDRPPPHTSQPPPGDFLRVFSGLTGHGHDVVYVGLSSALSGTLQAGESAAARVSSARRIATVDTRLSSVAQGLLAIDAAEHAAAGGTVDDIEDRVRDMQSRTRLYALIDDAVYGVRGGRAPRLAQPLTRWLRVRLIIGMNRDGRMVLRGLLFGRNRLAERFGEWIARRCRARGPWRVNIGHCDNASGAARLATILENRIAPLKACWVGEAGTGVGAHAGPGALIVGVQQYEPPLMRAVPGNREESTAPHVAESGPGQGPK